MATSPVAISQAQESRNGGSNTSSTIPVGSLSQQRLVAEALASKCTPTTSKKKLDGVDPDTSNSSFPWSVLQSSSADRERRASQSATKATPGRGESPTDGTRHGKRKTDCKTSNECDDDSSSRNGPSRGISSKSHQSDNSEASESKENEDPNSRQHSGTDGPNDTEPTGRTTLPLLDVQEGNSVARSGTADGEKDMIGKPPSRRTGHAEQQHLHSDEIAIGLPKENYKPRPSRSRSVRVEAEPLDLSVRPEKLAKAKRRKTAERAAALATEQHGLSENLATITSMGFSPIRAKQVLKDLKGDVEQAVARLCNPLSSSTQDSLDGEIGVVRRPQKTPADVPESGSGTIQADLILSHEKRIDETILAQPTKSTPGDTTRDINVAAVSGKAGSSLLRVEITPGKERTQPRSSASSKRTSRKVKRRKTTHFDENRIPFEIQGSDSEMAEDVQEPVALDEMPEPDINIRTGQDGIDGVQKPLEVITLEPDLPPNKRGRGRPRKVHECLSPRDTDIPGPHGNASANSINGNLKEVGVHPQPLLKERPAVDDMPLKSTPDQHVQEDSPSKSPLPAAALITPQKARSNKGSDQHSPINKGKVPHRVGLSRRIRIAPLLKVVKK